MCRKIRCDGNLEIFWKLNKAWVADAYMEIYLTHFHFACELHMDIWTSKLLSLGLEAMT